MRRLVSLSRMARRRDGRAAVQIPCHVQTSEFELPATVIDLSLGGAGIVLQPGAPSFVGRDLRHVRIDGLGGFDVVFRWKSHERMGVSFRSEAAREVVRAYFDANDIAPEND